MKPKPIFIQIIASRSDHPGQVEEGQYVVRDGYVVPLQDEPLLDNCDEQYSRKLVEGGDTEKAIAGRLLRKWRDTMRPRSSFNRKIFYPRSGVA